MRLKKQVETLNAKIEVLSKYIIEIQNNIEKLKKEMIEQSINIFNLKNPNGKISINHSCAFLYGGAETSVYYKCICNNEINDIRLSIWGLNNIEIASYKTFNSNKYYIVALNMLYTYTEIKEEKYYVIDKNSGISTEITGSTDNLNNIDWIEYKN